VAMVFSQSLIAHIKIFLQLNNPFKINQLTNKYHYQFAYFAKIHAKKIGDIIKVIHRDQKCFAKNLFDNYLNYGHDALIFDACCTTAQLLMANFPRAVSA
jgi:hypothetical protein